MLVTDKFNIRGGGRFLGVNLVLEAAQLGNAMANGRQLPPVVPENDCMPSATHVLHCRKAKLWVVRRRCWTNWQRRTRRSLTSARVASSRVHLTLLLRSRALREKAMSISFLGRLFSLHEQFQQEGDAALEAKLAAVRAIFLSRLIPLCDKQRKKRKEEKLQQKLKQEDVEGKAAPAKKKLYAAIADLVLTRLFALRSAYPFTLGVLVFPLARCALQPAIRSPTHCADRNALRVQYPLLRLLHPLRARRRVDTA